MEESKRDTIVDLVRERLLQRSQVGIKKYSTTLKENTKDNYLNHALEESLDLSNYLQTLLTQGEDITQIVKDTPNDQELGEKIRKIYG